MANPPKYRQTTIKAQVRAADKGKRSDYAVYVFSGRTFVKKD